MHVYCEQCGRGSIPSRYEAVAIIRVLYLCRDPHLRGKETQSTRDNVISQRLTQRRVTATINFPVGRRTFASIYLRPRKPNERTRDILTRALYISKHKNNNHATACPRHPQRHSSPTPTVLCTAQSPLPPTSYTRECIPGCLLPYQEHDTVQGFMGQSVGPSNQVLQRSGWTKLKLVNTHCPAASTRFGSVTGAVGGACFRRAVLLVIGRLVAAPALHVEGKIYRIE